MKSNRSNYGPDVNALIVRKHWDEFFEDRNMYVWKCKLIYFTGFLDRSFNAVEFIVFEQLKTTHTFKENQNTFKLFIPRYIVVITDGHPVTQPAMSWSNSVVFKSQVCLRVLGSQDFTAMTMKSSAFWDITPCRPLKFNQRFGGTLPLSSGSKNKPDKLYMLPASC
jgi:hypothetical protein